MASKRSLSASPAALHERAPSRLTRERIVATALGVLDDTGAEGFSLREVARRLEVYPASLYWHMGGGRDVLLAAAAGAVLTDLVPPAAKGPEDWRDWLRALFHRYRAAVRRHPRAAPVLGSQLVSNAGVDLGLVEALLATLSLAGFRNQALADAYNATVAAMLGFTTLEFAAMPAEDPAAWERLLRARVEGVDPAAYPMVATHLPVLLNRGFILRWRSGADAPLDSGFDAYVEAFLRGLGPPSAE
ncbi:MAG: TetR/AcrR family transcriptional regulator C-terminal domain-containing protein [Paracraurococcus sp.]